MPHYSSRRVTDWLLLAGFCGFLFFYGIAYFGLVGADEPRYAQIAREMLSRRDWITPTLGGKPWLEKPPLYYWQAMLSYRMFGVSDWAARLPSAFDATLLVVAFCLFLRRFRYGSEVDGALMSAATAGMIGFARAASTDMPLAAMFCMALLAWYAWYETRLQAYLYAFYIFCGLGTLAKGPVALLLPALIVILFVMLTGNSALLRRTLWLPGILLFCAVTVPWYVAVQWRNPDFLRTFILEHNLARFSTGLYHHRQPFWYYGPVTLLAVLPWTVYIVVGLSNAARAWWAERREGLRPEDAWTVFLVIWLIVPVAFFSLSLSKLPGYIVPAVPAATLLLAEYVRQQSDENNRPSILAAFLHSLVAVAPLIPALMIGYLVQQHRIPWLTGTKILCGLGTLVAVGMTFTLRTRAGFRALRFVTLVPVVLLVSALVKIGSPVLDDAYSARPLSHQLSELESELPPIAVFHVRREVEYGLAFYQNQSIARYERGEIPAGAHLLVSPHGSQIEVAAQVPGRRVSYLGTFSPQNLDYFWVSMPVSGHH